MKQKLRFIIQNAPKLRERFEDVKNYRLEGEINNLPYTSSLYIIGNGLLLIEFSYRDTMYAIYINEKVGHIIFKTAIFKKNGDVKIQNIFAIEYSHSGKDILCMINNDILKEYELYYPNESYESYTFHNSMNGLRTLMRVYAYIYNEYVSEFSNPSDLLKISSIEFEQDADILIKILAMNSEFKNDSNYDFMHNAISNSILELFPFKLYFRILSNRRLFTSSSVVKYDVHNNDPESLFINEVRFTCDSVKPSLTINLVCKNDKLMLYEAFMERNKLSIRVYDSETTERYNLVILIDDVTFHNNTHFDWYIEHDMYSDDDFQSKFFEYHKDLLKTVMGISSIVSKYGDDNMYRINFSD